MAFHLNTYGLMQRGFRLIAIYECFTKGQKKLIIECYKNDTEYLVRNFTSGSTAWDNVFDNRNEANAEVVRLRKTMTWYRRTL